MEGGLCVRGDEGCPSQQLCPEVGGSQEGRQTEGQGMSNGCEQQTVLILNTGRCFKQQHWECLALLRVSSADPAVSCCAC